MNRSITGDIFAKLQDIGKSLMLPVSVLPAAGLLVALGRLLTGLESEVQLVTIIGSICYQGGLAVFEYLPLLFAIGVAIGLTRGEGVAGLAATVGHLTLTKVLVVMESAQKLPAPINVGVFGGILVGMLTAKIFTRFSKTELHPVLGFFSGKRLVPILTAGSVFILGVVLGFTWPPIQSVIQHFGESLMSASLGPAFYAAGKRLLIPLGLHHVYYPPFLYQFGEFITSTGETIHGEASRYFAGDPTAGRFMASEFPIMLFGLPAATLAMFFRAPKNKRKILAGVFLSASLTSIITGITEPIEFSFIFVAPFLYILHVALAFLSGTLTSFLNIHLGYTFSASLIDFFLGFFNQKNSLLLFLVVGPILSLLYFSSFYWAIGFFNFKTPGREIDNELDVESRPSRIGNLAQDILLALGGHENILELDACITRLRLRVKNEKMVSAPELKRLGAAGTLKTPGGVFQIVFGTQSEMIKEEIKQLINEQKQNSKDLGRQISVIAPLEGEIIKLENVPDAVFSQQLLGPGLAINPSNNILLAPFDGEIVSVFHTGHALGLRHESGIECLIHIGLETVKMEGRGFKLLVKENDRVKKGDSLIEFDLNLIKKEAKSTISPIVFTHIPTNWRLILIENKIFSFEYLLNNEPKKSANQKTFNLKNNKDQTV